MEPKQLDIYLHIPFCIKRCRYCTACVITGDSQAKARYLEALRLELESALSLLREYVVATIYVGGGSPTVMSPDGLAKLVRDFRKGLVLAEHPEYTIEAMPQTIGTPSLSGIGSAGFTKLSLSVQSMHDSELEALDCGFNVQTLEVALSFLQRFHWNNLNLDLMYGNPLQTLDSWKKTLGVVRNVQPPHVSIYPFAGVGGTAGTTDTAGTACATGTADTAGTAGTACATECPDADQSNTGNPDASSPAPSLGELCPSAEESQQLFAYAQEYLKSLGYAQYTRYHFAVPGQESRHFLARYRGQEYLGFGLGARSFIDGITYQNTTDFYTYIEDSANIDKIVTNVIQLTPQQMKEYQAASQEFLVLRDS